MPPKDLPQPSPQDAGLPGQSSQIPQDWEIPQYPLEENRSYFNESKIQELEARNQEIEALNQGLRRDGLTPTTAIRVIQLNERYSDTGLSLTRQAIRVAAVDLGLIEADDPNLAPFEQEYLMPSEVSYLLTALRRDILTAVSLAEYSIDPREAIKEYKDFSWEEAIQDLIKEGETIPVKPRFTAFTKIIMHSAVALKAQELAARSNRLKSEVPTQPPMFGPGFRSAGQDYYSPENQAKLNEARSYRWASETVNRAALAKPKELADLSDGVWYGLVTEKVRKLATTQTLIKNSQFVDDILEKTKPIISFPGATSQYNSKLDLATIITPKVAPSS